MFIIEFNKNELIKSPLNYTGGKYKLLPQILPFFPQNINKFIDLFAGGCNVGVNIRANKIICNDSMTQIIDLYNSFQNNSVEEIYEHINKRITQFDLSMTNKEGYLEMRKLYNRERNPLDLYVCICYAFNYSIRFNSKGEFNIAFGKDRSHFNHAIQERLGIFVENIKKIKFSSNDFRKLKIDNLDDNDFVYADPPYLITVANYNENGGWTERDEYDLLGLLDRLSSNGVKFALSNVLDHKGKSNDILKEWSKKYIIHDLDYSYGNSNYQTKDKSKNSSREVLITNYKTSDFKVLNGCKSA